MKYYDERVYYFFMSDVVCDGLEKQWGCHSSGFLLLVEMRVEGELCGDGP